MILCPLCGYDDCYDYSDGYYLCPQCGYEFHESEGIED